MRIRRSAAATVAACAAIAAGCGTSGSTISRPIETVIYVSGVQGTEFSFAATPDMAACGSTGTGIQSPNADHQFGSRVFLVPHLFVLENARQPVRAVILNPANNTFNIRVDTFLGQIPQNSNIVITPGGCQSVAISEALPLPTPMPTPANRGPEIRVEVCSPTTTGDDLNLGTPCEDEVNDLNYAFFLSIGDVAATNISTCTVPAPPSLPLLDACRGAATIFLENPKDQVDAVMSVNPGQNPGGDRPTAQLRVELWVNDRLESVDSGVEPVVSAQL